MTARPAVFLDRDGTINVEVNYLHRPADLDLIPGVPQAIARLNAAGLPVFVVTNQAGIARGYYTVADMCVLHEHLNALLGGYGAHIDAFYYCPHHPEFTGPCVCRKPAPGMVLAAAADHDLDLSRSWLIGEAAGVMGAGCAAGCRTILVRTGYGAEIEHMWDGRTGGMWPEVVVDALPDAVDYILRQGKGPYA
jgi:D-glycero-D-manno-heptose 1,7-bisphosphate phosphatase